jgi:hypothetical protein
VSVFNRQSLATRNVAAAFMQDLGAGMHPRISIQGGSFGLLDAAGTRYGAPCVLRNTPQGQKLVMLAIIIGSNPKKSRVYYPGRFDPDNPEPPVCFSDNGVGPSDNAADPQARTCGECVFSKWGSDTSEMTGKKTKACSEKKKIAILVVGDTAGHAYELQVPPATLKNMAEYGAKVGSFSLPGAGRKADLCDVVTEISFVQGQTGVLEFAPHCLIDACTVDEDGAIRIQYDPQDRPLAAADGGESVGALIDDIWESDELDALLGLKDVPFNAPAGFLAPGMQPLGFIEAPRNAVVTPPPAAPTAFPAPYSPPPGHVAPQQAAPPPMATAQPQAQPAPRTRKKRGEAPVSTPQPQAALPHQAAPSVAAAPETETGIPDFLKRSRATGGGAPAAAPPTAGATSGAVQSFGNGAAPPPPNSMEAALATAFNLPTNR